MPPFSARPSVSEFVIPLRDAGDPDTGAEIPCFQCGVCCMKWQPLLSPNELKAMAASLHLTPRSFNRRYTRAYPVQRGHRQFITGPTGGCVFLQRAGEGRYTCSIYEHRPLACRAWRAGLDKKECFEGARA